MNEGPRDPNGQRHPLPLRRTAPANLVPCLPAIEVPRGITRLVDFRPRRLRLENGLRVIHERRPETGVVALELYVDAGFLREDRPGVSYLTGRLLEEGTRNRTALELAAAIEDVGGTMEVSPACSSLRIRVEDLPLACELLADLVRQPVFPPVPSNGPSSGFWPSCKTIGKIRPVMPT